MTIDNTLPDQGASDRRHFEYAVDQPITLDVQCTSTDIYVRTHDEPIARLDIVARSPKDAERVSKILVNYDTHRHVLEVREPQRTSSGQTKSKFLGRLLNIDAFTGELDYILTVPTGSNLDISTVSGDLVADGTYARIGLKGASSDAVIDTVNDLAMHVASGDLQVREIRERVTVRSASGDVDVADAQGAAVFETVSGDVRVTITNTCDVRVRSVSGDVRAYLEPGFALTVDARSTSGEVRSDISLDSDGATDDGSPTVVLNAKSMSGDIRIKRASDKRRRASENIAEVLSSRFESAAV